MRVAVLTFHHVANYGAALQAVALQRVLERHGHEVVVVDYRPAGARRHYRRRWYPVRRHNRSLNKRFLQHALKALRFERFVRAELHLTPRQQGPGVALEGLGAPVDAVVVGSDQVWDVRSRIRGLDPTYFLDFVTGGVRRLSYAASFGATAELDGDEAQLADLIRRFDAVAVRDAGSEELARGLGRDEVVRVADPTCLEPLWDLAVSPGAARPYLLLYAEQQLEAEEAAAVRRLADERGLEVVSVGFSHPVADRSVVEAGPREWLGWVHHADYLVTAMYHGTIFGVLAGTPLTVLLRPGRTRKLGDLLTTLELWDRVGPDADRGVWDAAPPQALLAAWAERSEAFLHDGLRPTPVPVVARRR